MALSMRSFASRKQINIVPWLHVVGTAAILLISLLPVLAKSQNIVVPKHLPGIHPRVATRAGKSQKEIHALIDQNADARAIVSQAETRLAPYLDHVRQDPQWMASRLQMYWKSHATDVYNQGDTFDHARGHAPVATVRYPGSRNPNSIYRAPLLEDIPPYEDDTRGVYLINTSLPDHPLEWAPPAKTGRVIDGINSDILRYAESAAQLAWVTGNEEYARFAFTIFDMYMRGMYYRNEPIDLNHGHSQTIYGMSTFEVIQESNLPVLANTYDFLHDYISKEHPDALPIYADAFRKWIDVTIRNGVPFNNWDLIEAQFVAAVALVLDDDSAYANRRGAQYYLNAILNENVTRQWSIRKLAARGFDAQTGIWYESPGYSMNVVYDFIELFNGLDRVLGTDLLQDIPVMHKAALSMAQYAFPNGMTVSWGDSHYGSFQTRAAWQMVINARMHHRRDQEVLFTGLIRYFDSLSEQQNGSARGESGPRKSGESLASLFEENPPVLDPSVPALKPNEVLMAAFSAPSASYFVQRNGLDPTTGLMISEAGSLGNHQHANGITMELYGYGLPLAPDSGIGTNYFEADHAEYYSQFPAHNTVVVDGVSSYPTMKSNHGFTVNAAFPASGAQSSAELPVTFSDASFLEPETNADQRRVMSIVRTSSTSGYYVDIFRSRRRNGLDLKHDYFFHGLGQQLDLADENGQVLAQVPTEKLTFADEELPAYDYLWDKHAAAPAKTYHAAYHLQIPNRSELSLNLWLTGDEKRELYSVLAPPARSLRDVVPVDIASLPLHTLVVRQTGQAWTHPFISIIEPSSAEHQSSISSVRLFPATDANSGDVILRVDGRGRDQQIIFDSDSDGKSLRYEDDAFIGTYGVAGTFDDGDFLFLGSGSSISHGDLKLELPGGPGSGFIRRRGPHWSVQLTQAGLITVPATKETLLLKMNSDTITPRTIVRNGHRFAIFAVPATSLTNAELTEH